MAQINLQQTFDLALQHHQSGRLQQAEQLYRQILAQQPNHADALHLLGVIAHQVGRNEIAVDLIGQAVALAPDRPAYHSNLGEAHRAAGRLDEAVASLRRAITLQPNYPEAFNNLGNALRDQGKLSEAAAVFRQAIALKAHNPDAYVNLGNALRDMGRLDEAIAAYQRSIALNPRSPQAHNNLGNALRDRGELDDALAAYHRAIALDPNYPEAHNNLGNALADKTLLDDATNSYRRAITLNPGYFEAYNNLGNALREQAQLDAAIAAYHQAIALKPTYPEAHNNLGLALKDAGKLDEAIAAYRHALLLKPDYPYAHGNLILALHYHPGVDASAIAGELRRWNQRHAAPFKSDIQPHANDRSPERRLRIGYISPDFRNHPAGRFLLPLLAHHDKSQYAIFAYSQVPVPDDLTRRLRSCTDAWRNLVGLSDAQAADLIRRDQIDILVDLALHTAHNRLLVLARQPAPVQVTYLAYCSSSGMDAIDYRLSDPYLDPPGGNESVYSERTLLLPQTYWCYQPFGTPPIGPVPALSADHLTFGSLNNFCKVSAPALAAWARLLQTVPKSQLLLHAGEGSHRRQIAELFRRQGIDLQRVRFITHLSMSDYLQLHQQIDIALDPFPFGGGATTCDALWMGVPVISLAGSTAVGRGGLSILSNLGLPELVASTPEQYVQIAAMLAQDLPRLTHLRATLRDRMQASPLMDAPRFARDIEAAFRRIWRQWCQTPAS